MGQKKDLPHHDAVAVLAAAAWVFLRPEQFPRVPACVRAMAQGD